jgi:hypothetical protein
MIDELKLVHCCLSVRLRRSVAGANSEVQRLNVAVSGVPPTRSHTRPSPSEALLVTPGESTAEFDT